MTDLSNIFIRTYLGLDFHPYNPQPEEINIQDIAHALACTCRFGGHCREYYSVAQHSVFVSLECQAEHALTGLLHDAVEAYIGDIPRPVRKGLREFNDLEQQVWKILANKFNLPTALPADVIHADQTLLCFEFDQLLPGEAENIPKLDPPKFTTSLQPLSPPEAEQLFLEQYNKLQVYE